MANYYAVKQGIVPGIYKTWSECQEQVKGYKGAIFKKFTSEEEAKTFVYGECDTELELDNSTKDEVAFLLINIKSILEAGALAVEDIGTAINYCDNIADALNIKLD